MSYKIETKPDQLNQQQWHDFIFSHPDGTIFQSPEMFRIFQGTKNYSPVVVACLNVEQDEILGILVAVIQKEFSRMMGFLSARSVIWGGPVVKNNDPEVVEILLSAYNKLIRRRVIYSQFRNLNDLSAFSTVFLQQGYRYENHLNILVNLNQTQEELWTQVHSKRRNEIRKAEKERIVVRPILDRDEFEMAMEILKQVYKHAKLPFPHSSLFSNAFSELRPVGYFQAYGAFHGHQLIGTMFTLTYKNRVYDWYAGSDLAFYDKHPNDLIPWCIFLDARDYGYSLFDFGGAGKTGVPYGIREYKLKFGGKMVEFGRFKKIHNRILFPVAKIGFYIYFKIFK